MRTVEEAMQWAADNREELDKGRLECESPDVQMFNRIMPELSQRIWDSGCWLTEQLKALGASDEDIAEAQFATGQLATLGNPWRSVVAFVNGYEEHGEAPVKPGAALALAIERERWGLGSDD